jgi:hypothetical protein
MIASIMPGAAALDRAAAEFGWDRYVAYWQ